jgi:hypothetical protein
MIEGENIMNNTKWKRVPKYSIPYSIDANIGTYRREMKECTNIIIDLKYSTNH